MSRNKGILLIGILVAIMPFLGFPATWKMIFYVGAGFILMAMAVVGHTRRRSLVVEEQTEVYVQTNGGQGR